MKEWKQAAALAKLELKYSKKAVLSLSAILIVYGFLLIYASPQLVETVAYDVLFLIFLGFAAGWGRTKEFNVSKMRDGSYGSPYFLFLHQLPIRNDILIKNRFMIYYIFSIPVHVLFFISLYLFSGEIRSILTFPEYVAFAVIWLAIGICNGTSFPIVDIGEVKKMSVVKRSLYGIIMIGVVGVGLVLLQKYTGYGIVYGSMIIAGKWPLIAGTLSVVTAIICINLALRHANKNIMKIDY